MPTVRSIKDILIDVWRLPTLEAIAIGKLITIVVRAWSLAVLGTDCQRPVDHGCLVGGLEFSAYAFR